MGGKMGIVLCALGVASLFGTGYPSLFWAAVANGIIVFWSSGLMRSYTSESARLRSNASRKKMVLEGRAQEVDRMPIQISPADDKAVPEWLSITNMIVTTAGLVFLAAGVLLRILL